MYQPLLDDRPIFITGSQRTGTTLLCNIISSHPDIFISNEIPSLAKETNVSKMNKDIFLDFLNDGMKNEYGLNLVNFLSRESKTLWGYKVPQLIYHLEKIVEFFPDCRIIFMVRDGRAYANSVMKTKWGIANIYKAGLVWNEEMDLLNCYMNKYKDKSILVKYEELISHTHETLISICDFLSVTFRNSMMEYYINKTYIKRNESSCNALTAVDKSFISKWKMSLTERQINVFELLCRDELLRHGYELVGKSIKINFMEKLFYEIHQRIVGEIQLQKKRNLWIS